MALNSSGPISFGGSTVGQSINLELGVSATAEASINSTSFRTLAGVSSGQISVSNFYGASNTTYYMAQVSGTNFSGTTGNKPYSIGMDSSGNYYLAAGLTGASRGVLLKFNSSLVFQNAVTTSGSVVSYFPSPTPIGSQILNTSSGNFIQFVSPTALGYIGTKNISCDDPTQSTDSLTTDGTYAYVGFKSSNNPVIFKYSVGANSLSVVWGTVDITGTLGRPWGIAVNASGEVAVVCAAPSTNALSIIKFNSSGGAVYTRAIASGINSTGDKTTVGIDSSGNVYVMGGSSTNSSQIVTKLDTSGNVSWSSAVTNTHGASSGNPVAGVCDASGNTYVTSTFSNNLAYMIARNSSGTVLWQKSVVNSAWRFANGDQSATNASLQRSVGLVPSGFVWCIGYVTSPASTNSQSVTVLTYPTSGSKNGSYTSGDQTLTIANSTQAVTAPTVTFTTPTTNYRSTFCSVGNSPAGGGTSTFTLGTTPTVTAL